MRTSSAITIVLAIAAASVVAICAYDAAGRLNRPFGGFFVWDNLFVPAVGEPSWTGATSGVRYQSWLVAADGRRLTHAEELKDVLAGHRSGEAVSYRFDHRAGAYDASVAVMTLHARAWAAVLGLYVFNAVALLALGVTVLYLKPADRAAYALFLFATNLSLYMAGSADLFVASRFRVPYFFFVNFIPATVLWLLSHFPVERRRRAWETPAIAAVAALGAVLAVATNAVFHGGRETLLALDRITHILLAAAGFAAIVFFCFHFVRAPSALTRTRTRVVLLGTLGAFTPPVVVLSVMYGGGLAVPLNYVTATFLLFPIGIGYAIARLDLFDIDRVIRRALVYAVLSAFVFGTYSLVIGSIDYYFENLTQWGSRIAEGLLILALIVLTSPSRDRIQDVVDRFYDRHRYDYRDVVRSTSRTFATILDFEKLVSEALALIDRTLQPTTAAVYAVEDGTAPRLHGRLTHTPAEPAQIAAHRDGRFDPDAAALVAMLTKTPLAAIGGKVDDTSGKASEGGFAAAMNLEGVLVGFLSVGAKRSGGYYTADDHELARTICDQLAVALHNAKAYDTIDLLNTDLGRKNVELERANVELRETQDELVQKERLAALGELSGAVAHAIRNPLAGIKAAAQLAALDLDGHPASEGLTDVISEADRLDQRIGALLQFSRPFEPSFRIAALPPVVEQAVRDTSAKAASKRITVVRTLDASLPQLEMDPVLIEQAILELVSNAIDASPEGATVEVSATTKAVAGAVAVSVDDCGVGINDRAAARLFELFYTTKKGGTGFGLATVKRILEQHGGSVEASNRPQGGASFRITLPLRARASRAVRDEI